MKRIIGVLFLLGSLASSGTLAQEKAEFFVRVERAFQLKENSWKVERIYPGNTPDPVTQSIVLRSRSGQASVELSIWRRQQDAEDVFRGQSLAFDNTGGKKKVKRSLPGFGDENHVWTNRGSNTWPTMKFRKGGVVVSVFAPTMSVAKRFAQLVLSEIAAN